jgi:oligopeptide transport system substrate-binding protein
MRPNISHFILLTVLTLLSACGSGESNAVQGNRDGILHYGNGSEPQGLDPHVVTGVPENHLVRALFEGLAVKNPYTLEPEPGVAESWDISEDRRGLCVVLESSTEPGHGQPLRLHAVPGKKCRGLRVGQDIRLQ